MDQNIIRLLVVEDEEFDVLRIESTLKPFRDRIQIADVVSSGEDALDCVERNLDRYDIIIMDYQISGSIYGEQLIRKIRAIDPTLQIIVITKKTINQTNLHFANQLIDSGAYWFGTKYPGDIEEFIYQPTDFGLSIINAYEKRRLEIRNSRSQNKLDKNIEDNLRNKPLIGESRLIQYLRELIHNYAAVNTTVLIQGESGTGKEIVAAHIHYQSTRKYENYITVNCAAIPRELIESELFGFEKGSFSGADKDKAGLFEQADGGTILLDEIGELPRTAQAKLLRVLQEGEIDKIGRKQKCKVDVRVLASTNRDLKTLVQQKQFREDLFYRLNILRIEVPPLRERGEDILLLFDYFINFYSQDFGIIPPKIDESIKQVLMNYHWRGNIRQLKSLTQRILLQKVEQINDLIVQANLGADQQKDTSEFIPDSLSQTRILTLKEMEQRMRKKYIQFVREHSQNDKEAASKLGMAPPNYHRMCKELGLK